MENSKRQLGKAKFDLMRCIPHFAYLVGHLNLQESNAVNTIGVDDKGRCFYSPSYISSLSREEVAGVLVHEVLHLALEHHRRSNGRTAMIGGHSVWNIATDLVINALIQESDEDGRIIKLPENGLIPSKDGKFMLFGIQITDIPKRTADSIYDELVRKFEGSSSIGSSQDLDGFDEHIFVNPSSKKTNSKDNKEDNGVGQPLGQGDSSQESPKKKDSSNEESSDGSSLKDSSNEGSPATSPSKSSGDKPSDEEGQEGKNWQKVMAEAIVIAKMAGKLPAGLERMFEELHHSKTNWKVKLRQTAKMRVPFDYSYRKPNRNYLASDFILPSMDGEKYEIVFAIDTSGSIDEQTIGDFVGEIAYIARSLTNVNVTILTHDVEVHNVYENIDPRKLGSIKINGGGGTSHIPVIERIQRLRRKTMLAVFLTDGFSEFPKAKPPFKVIFALSDNNGRNKLPKWATDVVLLRP